MHHDAGNTGSTTAAGPTTYQPYWQTTLMESITDAVPLVVNNRVYINTNSYYKDTTTHPLTLFGSTPMTPQRVLQNLEGGPGAAYCLNATTGVQIWRHAVYAPNHPVYLNGKLYFTDMNTGSYTGYLYCLNATTGTQVSATPFAGVGTSPTITANSKLYYGTLDLYSITSTIICASSSGTTLWTYSIPGYQVVFSAPAVDSGNLYVISCDLYGYYSYTGTLICLNADTGAYKWSHTIGTLFSYYYVAPTPIASAGKVYVTDINLYGYYSYIRCYVGSTGATAWSYPIYMGVPIGNLALSDGAVYGTYADLNAYGTDLIKLYATNGTRQWTTLVTANSYSLFGGTICGADNVLVTSSDGTTEYPNIIITLNKTNADYVWSYTLPFQIPGGLSLCGDTLYFAGIDGSVYAVKDQLKITRFAGGFLRAKAVLTNNGPHPFTTITWLFNVNGGYYGKISLSTNSTISLINGSQTIVVSIGPIFGIGKIHLDFFATPQGCSPMRRSGEGIVFGPFILAH